MILGDDDDDDDGVRDWTMSVAAAGNHFWKVALIFFEKETSFLWFSSSDILNPFEKCITLNVQYYYSLLQQIRHS